MFHGKRDVNIRENTHKLVQEKSSEYIGIKTGITTAAGPCLASCIRTRKDRYFIIVVLGCDKMSMRFKDTENLKKWLYNRESLQSPKKKSTTNE
jgi:D-alanyl-D-alanine carboxypeptidase (penicillin-binding protein 5/6)